jgi:hypothetical protein
MTASAAAAPAVRAVGERAWVWGCAEGGEEGGGGG